jgi:periplasmic protein CpxP/Spy
MTKVKRLMLLAALVLVAGTASMAQGGGPRRTVEERVKSAHEKLEAGLKLDAAKLTKTDSAFAKYYRATDKMREEMMAGGGQPDFQAMREKMQPLTDARDKELKEILGDDSFKKFKDEIEPTMRRGGGGGGGNNQ